MAILQSQLESLKRQLSGLETSQRVALGLCVVIIALAFVMLSQWAQHREMVPLYADIMNEEELSDTIRQLQLLGEDYEDRKGTLYVRPGDWRRLIMLLNERSTGPKTLKVTFENLVKEQDIFASAQKTEWQQNIALMNELAMTIEAWPRVTEAHVMVASESRSRRLNRTNEPKATVSVKLVGGQRMDKAVVESMARLVAGAVPGLEPQSVSVTDMIAGRSYTVEDPDDQFGSQLYELQQHKEAQLLEKIRDLLNYIPGVNAQVTVKIDDQAISQSDITMEEPPIKRELIDDTVTSNISTAQEPGVSANTSVNLRAGGQGQTSTKEKKETEFMESRGQKRTVTEKRPGAILQAAASIGVPRSYFVGALKAISGTPDEEPAPQQLDGFIEEQKQEIQRQVAPILDAVAERESTVVVTVFSDNAVAYIAPPPVSEAQEALTMQRFITANGRQLGLAALALLAMGMMMMMVRKAGAAAALPQGGEPDGPLTGPLGELTVDAGPIGKAGAPDAFLIAQETDESSIRARQIAQQVSDLINDDPEGAAQLVRRWIDRDTV